jgi:uncharacterized protein (TIGR02594 family)
MAENQNSLLSRFLTSMNRTHGDFRKSANDNNRDISKIVKDISGVFSSHKSSFNELSSALSEVQSHSAQSAAKIDSTNGLLQQSIGIQNSMLAELRSLTSYLKSSSGSSGASGQDNTGLLDKMMPGLGLGKWAKGLATLGLGAGAVGVGIQNSEGYNPAGGAGAGSQTGQITFGNLTEAQKTQFLENQARAEGVRPELNNPAGMMFSEQTKKFGAVAGPNNGTITLAQFPSLEAGKAAQRDLWERKYSNLPIDQAISKWTTGDEKAPLSQTGQNYKATLTKGLGLETTTGGTSGQSGSMTTGSTGGQDGALLNRPSPGSPMSGDATGLAESMLGKHENLNNQEISAFLRAGGSGLNPATEAWCAAFVNSALSQSGQRGTGSNVATSFLNWGTQVTPDKVQRGDIIVETRGKQAGQTGGHVGMATGQVEGSKVEMISGNQGNKVSKTWVDLSGDVQIRRGNGTGAVASTGTPGGMPGMNMGAGAMPGMGMGMGPMGMGGMGMMPGMGMPGMGMGPMGMMAMSPMGGPMDGLAGAGMMLGGAFGGGKGAMIGGLAGMALGAIGSSFSKGEEVNRRTNQINAINESAEEREAMSQRQLRNASETRNSREQSDVVNNQFNVAGQRSDYNSDTNAKASWWADLSRAFPELQSAVKFSA